MTLDSDLPYALKSTEEIERRRAMLTLPHIAPLITHAQSIVARLGQGYEIPYFDPCDGGVNAKVLFLLEAPGRKAVGSTFISRNNPDPSAKNMCTLLRQAGLPREITLLWNIVPWYVGSASRIRAVKKSDIETALPFAKELITLLPHLQVIVLVGRRAQSAKAQLVSWTSAHFFECYHPSLQAMNRKPERRTELLNTLVSLANFLRDNDSIY